MIILLIFAFISGLITILAPCIWPLLPIIFSTTSTGEHKKPLGITLGIIVSFGILTLSISYIVRIIPFDPSVLRFIAVFVIGLLGLTLVIPRLSTILESYIGKISGKVNTPSQGKSTGLKSGFLIGISLGIVWTPCAGPILATIATLAATQAVNFTVILVTTFYLIGIGIPLFIFASFGKYLFTKSRLLTKYTGRIQQVFGVVMIITALLIATNYDKVLQIKLLNLFPSFSDIVTNFESNQVVKKQLDTLKQDINGSSVFPTAGILNILKTDENNLFNENRKAPDFIGITNWLNTDKSLTVESLKGKVVLVDFWTYTCINCLRTLPHVTSWYEKYKDQGFVVIGVHTPEFEFEKNSNNVLNAVKQFEIKYPVAQDNNYRTWNNYNNQYWPAEYLIDAKGIIRRTHFGEGEYDKTEQAIQSLLNEAGQQVNASIEVLPDQTPQERMSPETYLGSKRMEYYFPTGSLGNGTKTFSLSDNLDQDSFSFGGRWNIMDEYAVSGDNATLNYNFTAGKVFIILRPADKTAGTVKVYLDGKNIDQAQAGTDVKNGIITVDSDRLYNVVDLNGKSGNHTLKLDFQTPGVEVFTFTFG